MVVLNQGLSLAAAATRWSLPKGTLTNWVSNAKGASAIAAPGARSVPAVEAEGRRRRQEVAEVRLEGESLKKATAYCARESRPGTRS